MKNVSKRDSPRKRGYSGSIDTGAQEAFVDRWWK